MSLQKEDKEDLAGIIEEAVQNSDSTKEAIETLHPANDINSKRLDKLSNLNMTQVDAMGVLEWQDKALDTEPGDWGATNITDGFTDKIKGLLVSLGREGRGEVSNVFKPAIFGDMMSQGMIPQTMVGNASMGVQKSSWIGKLFGRDR